MKAMILAAGRGERMKPLTLNTPKPLLKIRGACLIEHVLQNLANAGITEVVINVSYFAQQIMQQLGDGRKYGVTILYSHEEQQLLGTGGGVMQALPLLGEEPFLLISADIWTEYSLEQLVRRPLSGDVHLVMVANPDFNAAGDFGLAPDGALTLQEPKLTYANIGLIHPRLFANAKAGNFSLAPLLIEAIKAGKATGELFQGVWSNVGTPEILEKLT